MRAIPPPPCFVTATAALMVAMLAALPLTAIAQFNNQPFSFQRSGPATGVGMSSAYRQIILERQLTGRSAANNFVRGLDGGLVNVERRGDQAFGRPVAAPYSASQSLFSLGGGGGLSLAPGASPARPSATLNEDMPALFGGAPGTVPINSWIQQLSALPDLAS
jgi:hypothetical protein